MKYVVNENQVHIWIADVVWQDHGFVREYLSPAENARASRFRFEKDRVSYKNSRGILRFLLGHYFGMPPANVKISTTDLGKPYVSEKNNGQALSFNLSHSGGLVVYAFALNHPLGIDVEMMRPVADLNDLAARFFSENERASLHSVESQSRAQLFLQYWTRKEAYLKALGLGLSISPEEVDVSSLLNPSPHLTRFHPQIISDHGIWSLMDFYPTSESVASLVVDARVTQADLFRVNLPA